MDILNWLYLKKKKLIKTSVNNSATDLVVLGANVTFAVRGDKYQSYAMTPATFAPMLYDKGAVTQGTSNSTGVTLNTHTGIITLFGTIAGSGNAVFTVADTPVTATSKIFLQLQHTGGVTAIPSVSVTNIAAGTFTVQIVNSGAGSITAPKLHFTIID
jgi:hypothetical protein